MYVSKGTLVFDGVAISDTSAAARPLGLAHGAALACRRPRQTGGLCRRAAVTAARLGRILISAAAARVQGSGGAVYVEKGTLLFDRVAISDTSAAARPLGLAHGNLWAGAAISGRVVRAEQKRRRSVHGRRDRDDQRAQLDRGHVCGAHCSTHPRVHAPTATGKMHMPRRL